MDDVTKAELGQIRGLLEQTQRDLERLEGIAEGIFHGLIGKKKRDEWMEWWSSEDAVWMRRWQRVTPVSEVGLNGATSHRIINENLDVVSACREVLSQLEES